MVSLSSSLIGVPGSILASILLVWLTLIVNLDKLVSNNEINRFYIFKKKLQMLFTMDWSKRWGFSRLCYVGFT